MSQGFRLKYDEMRDSDPTKDTVKDDRYSSEGYVRNVCFVLLDGNRMFLNYAYLVSGQYIAEEGRIVLSWTTHMVSLAGICLEPLYYEFMQHIPRQVICQQERYNPTQKNGKPVINVIIIRKND